MRRRCEHERRPVGQASEWVPGMAGTHPSGVASSRPDGQQLEMRASGADHRHLSNLDVATMALGLAQ